MVKWVFHRKNRSACQLQSRTFYEVAESFHLSVFLNTRRQAGPDICHLSSAVGIEELSLWRSRCALDSHRALWLYVRSGSSLCRTWIVRVRQPQPPNPQPLRQNLQSTLPVSGKVLGLYSGDVSTPLMPGNRHTNRSVTKTASWGD